MSNATFELSLTPAQILDLVLQLPKQGQIEIVSGVLEQERGDDLPVMDATIQLLKDWGLIGV